MLGDSDKNKWLTITIKQIPEDSVIVSLKKNKCEIRISHTTKVPFKNEDKMTPYFQMLQM